MFAVSNHDCVTAHFLLLYLLRGVLVTLTSGHKMRRHADMKRTWSGDNVFWHSVHRLSDIRVEFSMSNYLLRGVTFLSHYPDQWSRADMKLKL